jgi:hypothetical protein
LPRAHRGVAAIFAYAFRLCFNASERAAKSNGIRHAALVFMIENSAAWHNSSYQGGQDIRNRAFECA